MNLQLFLVLKIFLSMEFIVIDIGISRSRDLLSNMIRSQNKSWSIHCGEERAKGGHSFDLVLTIDFWSLLIVVNALTLANWTLIIC